MIPRRRSWLGERYITKACLLIGQVASALLLIPAGARAYDTTTVNGTNPAYLTVAVGETKTVTFQAVDASFNPIPSLPVTLFYYTAYNYTGDPYFSALPLAPPTNANGTGIPAYLTDASGQLQIQITGTQPASGRVIEFLIPQAAFANATLIVDVTPGCSTQNVKVNITTPVAGTNFFISAVPQMPAINVTAAVSNVLNPSCFSYLWTYNIVQTFTVLDSSGNIVSTPFVLSNGTNPDTTSVGQWTPAFPNLAGGGLAISVNYANSNTMLMNLKIYGSNPDKETLKSLLTPPPDNRFDPSFDQVIAYMETNVTNKGLVQFWHQFDTSTAPMGGPVDALGNPITGLPLHSKSDCCGYGAMQLTNPAPTIDQLWDWVSNINGGKQVITSKYTQAKAYLDQHPSYTVPMLEEETYQRYNTGHFWCWKGSQWVQCPPTGYGKQAMGILNQVSTGNPPTNW